MLSGIDFAYSNSYTILFPSLYKEGAHLKNSPEYNMSSEKKASATVISELEELTNKLRLAKQQDKDYRKEDKLFPRFIVKPLQDERKLRIQKLEAQVAALKAEHGL